MSTLPFMAESVEPSLPVTSTPEPSRRYVQWKEEDIRLLLSDLEQPGHYGKWKENKSGYSKRVAEQVFKNVMYHEAIKFKVRWLEGRFKIWNENLTSVEADEAATNNVREKIFKEFPYYDRCKHIFDVADSPVVQPVPIATAEHDGSCRRELAIMKPEPSHMTNEPSSPTLYHYQQRQRISEERHYNNKRLPGTSTILMAPETTSVAMKKRRRTQFSPTESTPTSFNSLITHQQHPDEYTEEKRLKTRELELEFKKMDHHERMAEMKLEQLRLEIELQKLKRDTPISAATVNNSD